MASIQQRPNGSWRARYDDPSGKERSQHFPTKAAATEFLARQVVRLGDGTWIDPQHGKRLFRSVAAEWQTGQLHHRASTTTTTTGRLAVLIDRWGDVPIAAIEKAHVQAWVAGLVGTYSAKSIEALYRLLAQVMLYAVDERYLTHTPCRKVRLPEVDTTPLQVASADEIAALYAAAPAHGRALILAGVGTGLRISEMAGLTVDRVDFLRRLVTVDRQLVGTHLREPVFGPPKTRASTRTIPVPQDVIDEIAAHLAQWPSDSVVFRNAHGTPWRRQSLSEELRRWRKAAGRADAERARDERREPFDLERLTWHDLRHHYASGLIHAGLSPTAVQHRLGHASITVTMDTYGHLWPNDDDSTRAAAEGLVGAVRRTADGLPSRRSRSGA